MIDSEITSKADAWRLHVRKYESDFRSHVQKVPTTF